MNSTWVKHAISEINADYQRSADTHLIRLPCRDLTVFSST